jgi:periplasmic protein CpxP/Spy
VAHKMKTFKRKPETPKLKRLTQMKFQSVKKYAASALLLPVAGFAILQSAAHFSPAGAKTIATSKSVLAQNALTQEPTQEKEGENKREKMFQQLNLSVDQQAQIKSIMEQSKTSNQGLRQQVKAARDQLKTLMVSSDASDDAIRQAHQQVQTLGQQMGDQRFDSMLKVRAVLTPEQRTKLAELRKQDGDRHRDRQDPAANSAAS